MVDAWSTYMNAQYICCLYHTMAALHKFEAFISESFSFYLQLAFGAIMYLLEPKGGESGRSVGV
jgi:hypothetical protein